MGHYDLGYCATWGTEGDDLSLLQMGVCFFAVDDLSCPEPGTLVFVWQVLVLSAWIIGSMQFDNLVQNGLEKV